MTRDKDKTKAEKDLLEDDLGEAESLLSQGKQQAAPEKSVSPGAGKPFNEEITPADAKTVIDAQAPSKRYADLHIYKDNNMIAVRLEGRNYTSQDANLPNEVRVIMNRVAGGDSPTRILKDYQREERVENAEGKFNGVLSRIPGLIAEQFGDIYRVIIAILTIVLLVQIISIIKGCG